MKNVTGYLNTYVVKIQTTGAAPCFRPFPSLPWNGIQRAPNIVTVHHRGLFYAPEISLLVQFAFQDFVVRDIRLLSVVSHESHFGPLDPLDYLDPTFLMNLLTQTFWCLRIWEIYITGWILIRVIKPKANKQSQSNASPFTTLYLGLSSWYLWLSYGTLWNCYLRDPQ